MDQLRQEQRCIALAPVDEQQQQMRSIQSHRCVSTGRPVQTQAVQRHVVKVHMAST